MRDALGFVEERCLHCNARLYVSDEDAERGNYRGICLNACSIPTWQYREMQQGLSASMAKVDAELRQEES